MAAAAAAAGGATSGPQTMEERGIGATDSPPGVVAGEEGARGEGGGLLQEGAAAEIRGEGVQERVGTGAGGVGEAEGGAELSLTYTSTAL